MSESAKDVERPRPRLVVRTRRVAGAPVIAVRAWLRGGSRAEPAPGVAWACGRLLAEGTRGRDWRRIAAEAEERGATLHGFAAYEVHGVAADALAEDWERVLEWVAEMVLEPTFPGERWEWMVRQGRTELDALRDQPELRTAWEFLRHLYEPSPRSRPGPGSEAALADLEPRELAAFHDAARTRGVVLTVAGDLDEEAVEGRARGLLASLAGVARELPPAAEEGGLRPLRRVVETGAEDQAHFYLGQPTVPRDHPDHPALEVAGVVLGAGPGLTGRIPMRVREQEGLAYAAGGDFVADAGVDPGRLAVYVGTAPARVERAESVVREELQRLWRRGVEPGEVEAARTYLLGREAFRRETARQWAHLLAEATHRGLPLEDLAWRRRSVESVGVEEVNAALRRHLRLAELKVTVGIPGRSV